MAIEVVDDKKVSREELNLKRFFQDMDLIGRQVRDTNLKKPTFNYGDLGVTNYLLWLVLAELMIINNREVENA